MRVTVEVDLIKIGPKYLAITQLGGFRVQSTPAGSPVGAFWGLMWKLSGNGPQSDEAELGVELACANTTLDQELNRQDLLVEHREDET